jgi:hypothetical protein
MAVEPSSHAVVLIVYLLPHDSHIRWRKTYERTVIFLPYKMYIARLASPQTNLKEGFAHFLSLAKFNRAEGARRGRYTVFSHDLIVRVKKAGDRP